VRPADRGTSGADVQVTPDELRRHSAHVWSIGDEITAVASAAGSVSMSHDALGLLLGFVGGWFQDTEQDLAAKFERTNRDLHDDALHLRGAAGRYEEADQRSAQRSDAVGGGLSWLELPL
jgi:hypothetical protein